MSILVGIKQNHASGTFYGSEGLGGISMSATQLDILKEGSVDELKEYVKDLKSKSVKARELFYKIEDNLEFSNMSEKEYEKAEDDYRKDTILDKYSKLMILEGIIL